MAEDCPLGKFLCLLKQSRIQKLRTWLFSPLTVLMTKMIFYKKKKKNTTQKVRFGGISLQSPWLAYPKPNGVFSTYHYFCITYCSDRRLTTIDFKELVYLMPVFLL